jgi:AraC-like DNA-binding protein
MLLYGSLAAGLLAIISLVFNWNTNRNAIFLSALLVILAIHGMLHAAILNKEPFWLVKLLYNQFSPAYFLTGPMLFFYVRGTITDKIDLTRKDILHFIPAFIILINVFPYILLPTDQKDTIIMHVISAHDDINSFNTNWLIPADLNFIIRALLILAYIGYSFQLLKRYQKDNSAHKNSPKNQELITMRWLYMLIACMLIIFIGYIYVAVSYSLKINSGNALNRILFNFFNISGMAAFIAIPLILITFPQILYGIPAATRLPYQKNTEIPAEKSVAYYDQHEPAVIPVQEITEEETIAEPFTELASAVMAYLQSEKPYLSNDFSIDTLARAMAVPRHHLYYCMNRVIRIKFPDLRNKLRVEHAKKLLESGEHKNLSIEGIGFQSGFSSRSNFFSAFKKETGSTPSAYLLNCLSAKESE